MSFYPTIRDIFDGEPLIPLHEPSECRAGDTVRWKRGVSGYPSGANTLSYTLVSRTATIQVNGGQVAADGEGFAITILAATTAGWAPGKYRWQAYILDADSNRFTVGEGMIAVLPNLQASTAGIDDREDDEKILDAIKAMLAGKVLAEDAQMYEIHGRKLQRYAFAELSGLRSEYEIRVRAIRIRRGERVPSRSIGVKFNHGF